MNEERLQLDEFNGLLISTSEMYNYLPLVSPRSIDPLAYRDVLANTVHIVLGKNQPGYLESKPFKGNIRHRHESKSIHNRSVKYSSIE